MNEIRILGIKEIGQFIELATKAVHERGYADIDFDKTNFNIQIKQLLSLHNNISFGLFKENILIGFIIAQTGSDPWSTKRKCHIQYLHMDTSHRHKAYYQLLLDAIYNYCKEKNITNIKTSTTAYLLDNNERLEFLIKNGFQKIDVVWEKV